MGLERGLTESSSPVFRKKEEKLVRQITNWVFKPHLQNLELLGVKTNTLRWSIGSCEQPETFSTSLTMTARYLTPGYFCRSSNEDLDFRVSLLIFQAQVHQRAYTPRRCYSTLMSHTSMHAVIPVSSSGRPLDMIHGTSLRGRHGDEEISPGGIQSLLVLLPAGRPVAAQRTSYLSHFRVSPLRLRGEKTQHQLSQRNPLSLFLSCSLSSRIHS